MSRSNDGKDTGAERGMQPEKPRDANEVCQKEVDLEMIRCSGSTRIKERKRERVVQLNIFGSHESTRGRRPDLLDRLS